MSAKGLDPSANGLKDELLDSLFAANGLPVLTQAIGKNIGKVDEPGRAIDNVMTMTRYINLQNRAVKPPDSSVGTQSEARQFYNKMFGKSVGMRALRMFVSMLKRKAVSAGASVTEFPTRTTKLSQVCLCGQVKKKSLFDRWHICDFGVVAQRDLFSALLASCVESERLNAEIALELWSSGMDTCLRAGLSEVKPAIGGDFPATFGLNRSRSGSPVEVCAK